MVTIWNEGTTISQGGVEVECHLESTGGGIIGTIDLFSSRDSETEVSLIQEFPQGLGIETAGFRDGYDPDAGTIGPLGLDVEVTIEADAEQIQYGVRLAEEADEVIFPPPRIESVRVRPALEWPLTDGGSGAALRGDGTSLGDQPEPAIEGSRDREVASAVRETDRRAVEGEGAGLDPAAVSDELEELREQLQLLRVEVEQLRQFRAAVIDVLAPRESDEAD